MTTGRINQVANPSSTRGRVPRGTSEERRRAARATARRPTREGEPDGLGRGRSAAWASAGGVAVAVVLGREAPMHTPLAHVVASLLGRGGAVSRGTRPFGSAWTRPRTSCLERAVRRTGHRVPY